MEGINSQIIHEHWCPLNLGTECCECKDRVSICKYLLVVRKLMDKKITYLKRILSIEEDEFVNNLNDVRKNDVVFFPQSPEFNLLSPTIDDTNIQDDSLGIVQVETLEVHDVLQIQVRLAKLNDLYVELGRNFFITNHVSVVGLEYIKNAIKSLNAIKEYFHLPSTLN